MRRLIIAVPAALALLGAAGCNDLDVGDLNNPGLENLQDSPTRVGILTLATGMQISSRYSTGSQNGYNAQLGILGREIYNFDPADPRFITEMLLGPLDGGSPAFGGNLFQQFYADIRTGNILLRAMSNLTSTDPQAGLTAEEREGLTGYVQTLQAYDLLRIINTRDENGAPIDVDIDPTGPPAPIATKTEVFGRIVALLEEAVTHLNAAGATFPFQFSAGYDGFDTPPTFLTFNRALRARVAAYQGDWNGVLAALAGSFVNSVSPLSLGVYHSFSTQAGDSLNNLFDPDARALLVHPSMENAQLQGGGQLDQRFLSKTTQRVDQPDDPAVKTSQGLSSDLALNVYTSSGAAVPIIRNEELILLRAEANINLNNLGPAVTDLNEIRAEAGGLPPYAGALTQPALIDELLYNRRYSLFMEGGHAWIDARRYNRLTALPQDASNLGTTLRFSKFPFPSNECLARETPPATGCSPESGF
jgi:hypothetical protein